MQNRTKSILQNNLKQRTPSTFSDEIRHILLKRRFMKTLAIVGASGLVGEKLINIVADKRPPVKLRLFGNASVGKKVEFCGKKLTIEPCCALTDGKIDYAMFMANEQVAQTYVTALSQKGVICIDNSAHFRLKRGVPLVVTSVNGDLIKDSKIIANPNCSTIQTVIAVNALKSLQPVKMTAATYQSVSGAGRDGITDLLSNSGYGKLKCFEHPIADNLIPHIGETKECGLTSEELKLVYESKKILRLPRLKVNSFCCRVPITVGHGVFVNLQCRTKIDVDEARSLLSAEKNIIVMDGSGLYPMPQTIRNTKYVAVGRISRDPTNEKAINMFIVADNLLRGAAYNAYEILEECMKLQGDLNE